MREEEEEEEESPIVETQVRGQPAFLKRGVLSCFGKRRRELLPGSRNCSTRRPKNRECFLDTSRSSYQVCTRPRETDQRERRPTG